MGSKGIACPRTEQRGRGGGGGGGGGRGSERLVPSPTQPIIHWWRGLRHLRCAMTKVECRPLVKVATTASRRGDGWHEARDDRPPSSSARRGGCRRRGRRRGRRRRRRPSVLEAAWRVQVHHRRGQDASGDARWQHYPRRWQHGRREPKEQRKKGGGGGRRRRRRSSSNGSSRSDCSQRPDAALEHLPEGDAERRRRRRRRNGKYPATTSHISMRAPAAAAAAAASVPRCWPRRWLHRTPLHGLSSSSSSSSSSSVVVVSPVLRTGRVRP